MEDAHGNGAYEIQDLRKGLRIRLEKEHVMPEADSVGGEHKQGSAVCWIGETEPTTKPDGATPLDCDDEGRVWFDMVNLVARAITDVSGATVTWTPFGELSLAVYTEGNEPDRGLYVKGNELYFKGPDASEKLIAGLIDEDDMASDLATKAPSQQSVTAFVASGTVTMTNKTLTSPTLTSPVINTGVSGTAIDTDGALAADSHSLLASQKAVKRYVNDQVGTKGWTYAGSVVFDATLTAPNTWQDLDLSWVVGTWCRLVHLQIYDPSGADLEYAVKTKGYGDANPWAYGGGSPTNAHLYLTAKYTQMTVMTTSQGVIQHACTNNTATVTVTLLGYAK